MNIKLGEQLSKFYRYFLNSSERQVDSDGHRLGLGEHRDLSTLTSFVMFKF